MSKKYHLKYPDKAKRLAKELGLSDRSRSAYYKQFINNKNNVKEFSELYTNPNVAIREIRDYFGLNNVAYVAKKLNLSRHNPKEKLLYKKDEFIELWNAGDSYSQIAEKLDIAKQTVILWRKKLNLKPRKLLNKENRTSRVERLASLLRSSDGACSLYHIDDVGILNNIEQIIASSSTFDYLRLDLGDPQHLHWSNGGFFGSWHGHTLIFFRHFAKPLILKISQIISQNKFAESKQYTREKNSYITRLLFKNHQSLKIFQNVLFDLVNNSDFRSVFSSNLDKILHSDDFENYTHEIRSTPKVLQNIILNSKQNKFFGTYFSIAQFLDDLLNSSLSEQLDLLESLFCAMNFSVSRIDKNPFFDLKIESGTTYCVKLMAYQTITHTNLQVGLSNLDSSHGIVISLQDHDRSLEQRFSDSITILTKNDLEDMLNLAQYLPVSKNTISEIMFGDDVGKFALVSKLNFKNSQADVVVLPSGNKSTRRIGSLKQILPPSNTNSKDLSMFVSKVLKITNEEALSALNNLTDTQLTETRTRYLPNETIKGVVSANRVHILIPAVCFSIGTIAQPNGPEYCKTMLSCECEYWQGQHKDLYLCRHLISFMFYIWNMPPGRILQISEFDATKCNNAGRSFINFLLDEIHFLTRAIAARKSSFQS